MPNKLGGLPPIEFGRVAGSYGVRGWLRVVVDEPEVPARVSGEGEQHARDALGGRKRAAGKVDDDDRE